jgi:hypothetical protein
MITHVCVAIQLLGAPAPPDATQALQEHCDSVLGAGECRLTRDGTNDDKNQCWRATVVRTADDVMATVVVGGSGAAGGRVAQRDVKFQSNDERTDRWATLGLVVAALVNQEEHAAAASAATAPTSATPPRADKHWPSRDRSEAEPATISGDVEESTHERLHLADVRLLGVADMGRLPWATVGARVAATTGLTRHLDLEIGFAYLTSTGAAVIPSGGGIHFSLSSATLGLCQQSGVNRNLTGHICVGADLAEMTATSVGSTQPQSLRHFLPNAWFGFDSALRLTRHLALIAEYKGEVSVATPPSVMIANTVANADMIKVYQASRFSQNVALGVAGVF